jgi:HK97 family phage prohead protease
VSVLEDVKLPIADGALERRQAAFDTVEFRDDGDKLVFTGHAAVFDRLSEDLGGFRERVQRGAFRKVLDAKTLDVRFLFNHNPDLVLARSTVVGGEGSVELREDPKGLRVYAELVPTSTAKDLRMLVKSGVVSQMSFGFRIHPDGKDVWQEEDGELIRTIVSFGELFDVSPVTYPAYPQTDASMRSTVCGVEILTVEGAVLEQHLRDLAWKIHRGQQDATVEERAAIDAAFARTATVSPWIAERTFRAASQEPELLAAIPGKTASVVIEDAPSGETVPYRLAARQRRLRAHAPTSKEK